MLMKIGCALSFRFSALLLALKKKKKRENIEGRGMPREGVLTQVLSVTPCAAMKKPWPLPGAYF